MLVRIPSEPTEDRNLHTYVADDPINRLDVEGLWGVIVGGRFFGRGNPTFDFDFNKDDWKDLNERYKRNTDIAVVYDATGGKCAMTVLADDPSPPTAIAWLSTTAATGGALIGSFAGYEISNVEAGKSQ